MYSWSRYSIFKSLLSLHDDFPFFTERKKIKKSNKLACGRYIEQFNLIKKTGWNYKLI